MKTIELSHPFKDILPNVDEFFLNKNKVINTINGLCDKIAVLSEYYAGTIDENDFKGWALELFVEYLIKTNESDNRIGIYDYVPVNVTGEKDYGVDGYGLGENENPATVQVKYRNGDYILTANNDGLTNFTSISFMKYGVSIEDTKNMLLITTGMKVDERVKEEMLMGKVRVLNREALRKMCDNRPEWWTRFYESVKASRTKKNSKKIAPVSLRPHQVEAVAAVLADDNGKGKVILPTGTGKTIVEAEIIRNVILEKQKTGVIPIIKVNSSRILLCFQLFEEVYKYLSSHGIEARYVNYNSGQADDRNYAIDVRKRGGIYRSIVSTTSTFEVKNAYKQAVKDKLPLIVFSTYHSGTKFALSKLVPHLTVHDEAHNLVSREFNNVAKLQSEKSFFFTATEKTSKSDDSLGMNNPKIFDNLIYFKSPKQMIDAGEMVPPHVHVIRAKKGTVVDFNKLERDYGALVLSVKDAFLAHQKRIKNASYKSSEVGAKVLVVCRGQEDLFEMFKSHVFETFKKENPDIHIYALSSDFGLYNDGVYEKGSVTSVKKAALLRSLKELKPNEQAIVFHVDMIGEGIDVPGITGVMPFRNLELNKFVQNIGRASRLHREDRERLYSGKISPANRKKWIKPYSWVIIPTFLENSAGYTSNFRDIVKELRNNYGYIPRQDTFIDNVNGLDEEEQIDTVNDTTKNSRNSKSGLKEFEHEFENVSVTEQILFEEEVEKDCEKASVELDDLIALV